MLRVTRTPEILWSWYRLYGTGTLSSSGRTEWQDLVRSPKPFALSSSPQSSMLGASDNAARQLTHS